MQKVSTVKTSVYMYQCSMIGSNFNNQLFSFSILNLLMINVVQNLLPFCSVDTRYNQLQLQAADRRHKLLDALSLHQLNRDAYIVDSWINEKVSWMNVYKLSEYLGFKE